MKKIFSLFVCALMLAQVLSFSVVAAEADVTFTLGTITDARAGQSVLVPLTVSSTVEVNSIAVAGLTYDTNMLEFVGFKNAGSIVTNSKFGEANSLKQDMKIINIGMNSSAILEDELICDVEFVISESYDGVEPLEVTFTTSVVKNNSIVYKGAVEAGSVSVVSDVFFAIGEGAGRAGETIEVPVSITTDVEINSIALSGLNYEDSVMTFAGVSVTSEWASKLMFPEYDKGEGVITFALKESEVLDGEICRLLFTVDPELELEDDTNYPISYDSVIAKNNSRVYLTECTSGFATVLAYILGDINMDEFVDIQDAALLYDYSMLPEFFTITYPGDVDFNEDGSVDLQDAALLYDYSMLPEFFPLFPSRAGN